MHPSGQIEELIYEFTVIFLILNLYFNVVN